MKIRDIIFENVSDRLRSEVINLLDVASENGINKFEIDALLSDLNGEGYSIDEDTLLPLLAELEIVQDITDSTISISTREEPETFDQIGDDDLFGPEDMDDESDLDPDEDDSLGPEESEEDERRDVDKYNRVDKLAKKKSTDDLGSNL